MAETSQDAPKQKESEKVDEIQDALESILAKKNLAKEQFLVSKMNPQMYIPISVLLLHERLRSLQATKEQVVAAAAKSKRLGVDEQKSMVRPVLKSKRNVVILRDLPEGTTEEEIMDLLSTGPYGEKVVSVKPEVNNTWFVKFSVDDGIQDIVLWLKSQTFKGKPLNAALKCEHFLRSFFPASQDMGFVPPGFPPVEADFSHGFHPAPLPGGKGGCFPDFMPPPGMMYPGMEVPMEPNVQFGLQSPGFWKPWGSRYRQPPVTFSADCLQLGSEAPFDVRDGSKGKSKGKDFGKGKPKGKGKWGKWNDGWDDSRGEELPPGYGQKGKPSWFEESQEMPHGRDAPKMRWAVKAG